MTNYFDLNAGMTTYSGDEPSDLSAESLQSAIAQMSQEKAPARVRINPGYLSLLLARKDVRVVKRAVVSPEHFTAALFGLQIIEDPNIETFEFDE